MSRCVLIVLPSTTEISSAASFHSTRHFRAADHSGKDGYRQNSFVFELIETVVFIILMFFFFEIPSGPKESQLNIILR